jgi:hypothetical protein
VSGPWKAMREPKRLAHRQAERNKARAMKRWWDEDEETADPQFGSAGSEPSSDMDSAEFAFDRRRYEL